jgi:hypothetical protein
MHKHRIRFSKKGSTSSNNEEINDLYLKEIDKIDEVINTTDKNDFQKQEDPEKYEEITSDELFSKDDKTETVAEEIEESKKNNLKEKYEKGKLFFSKTMDNLIDTLQNTDVLGEEVYLEDTGEKLGVINDLVYNEKNKIFEYIVKDDSSNIEMNFPVEYFTQDKEGFIFTPGWYVNAVKTIEKIEFKEKTSPELTGLFTDDFHNREYFDLIEKQDQDFNSYIEEGKDIRKMISVHVDLLEKRRNNIEKQLKDLTSKRLLEDIDRRGFSEQVNTLRKRWKLINLNIKRCNDLQKRFDNTVIGKLSNNEMLSLEKKEIHFDTEPKEINANANLKEHNVPYYDKLKLKQELLDEILGDVLEDKLLEDIKKQIIKKQLTPLYDNYHNKQIDKKNEMKDEYIEQLKSKLSDLELEIEMLKIKQDESEKKQILKNNN